MEFALAAPALILVLLGIIQVGLTLNNYIMLTGGTQVAARQFALSRGSATPTTDTVNRLYGSTQTLTKANLTITLQVNGTACASGHPPADATNTACQAALNSQQGQPATVIASYPCSLKFYGHDFAPGCTLTSRTTESIE